MAITPYQFFRFMAENSELVMMLFERGEFDESELHTFISRNRSASAPSDAHIRHQLEELGVVEQAAHADALFEVSQPVTELFNWLTRRQRMSSSAILGGYIDDIASSNRSLEQALECGDTNLAILALRELESSIERIRTLSVNNRDAVIGEAQSLRSNLDEVSAVERFAKVRWLWERLLEPLQQLISVGGEMQRSLERLVATLDEGERRFITHGAIARGFTRARAKVVRTRSVVLDAHREAITEVSPLYERAVRHSRWLQGASRGLAIISAQGVGSLALNQRLGLTGWQPRSLLSDVKLRARMLSLADYQPQSPKAFAPPPAPPPLPFITNPQLRDAAITDAPIDDVLAFVLRRWPSLPLAAQLRAFGVIVGGALGPVTLAESGSRRGYQIPGGHLEAWPLSLLEVEP